MLIKDKKGRVIKVLTTEEVIELHSLLSTHPQIKDLTAPVLPPGVKFSHLLESAVSRQYVGFGEHSKYDDIYKNCASLVYGIACNHAFNNGNKRAALLCMIKHLYRNGMVLPSSLNPNDIYSFLTSIVDKKIPQYVERYERYERLYRSIYGRRRSKGYSEPTDQVVDFIAGWIKKNSIPYVDSDRPVNWNLLLDKLVALGLKVEMDLASKKVKILRTKTKFYFIHSKTHQGEYPVEGSLCPLAIVEQIRKDFELTSADGFDTSTFHTEKTFLDEEIILFKQAIYQLSDG
jgi:death-on-curing protein